MLAWAPFLWTEATSTKRVATSSDDDDLAERYARLQDEIEAAEEGIEPQILEDDEPEEPEEEEETEGDEKETDDEEEGEKVAEVPADNVEQPTKPPSKYGSSGPLAPLKGAFESEPRDSLWAGDQEPRLINLLLDAEILDDNIGPVKCQRTVCKLEVTWAKEDNEVQMNIYKAVRAEFGLEVGFEPKNINTESETYTMHIYIPRKGYSVAEIAEF